MRGGEARSGSLLEAIYAPIGRPPVPPEQVLRGPRVNRK
jgi:hypothetical protein